MAGEPASNRTDIAVAIRRCPGHELAIHQLIDTDENFQEICEQLAEAEAMLSRIEDLPVSLREARRAEWLELIDRLDDELRATLRKLSHHC